jgi:hypothetical protein
MRTPQHIQQMMKKLQKLPPRQVSEVEDFIDFLSSRDPDRALVRAVKVVTEKSLTKVWNNTDDAVYDRL